MMTALEEAEQAEREAQEAAAAATGASAAGKRTYVQRIFSEIAPRYDLLNRLLSLGIDRRWRKIALRRLAWTAAPAGTYLDLCAGTLDVGTELSRQKGFGGRIVGADFAQPMLQAGAGKTSRDVLVPVVADALALPVRDAAFDGAIVAFGIRNVSDLDGGLREVYRTLKPGAKFVILEFSTPRVALVRVAYLFYFHRILPLIGRLISGHRTAYTYLPRSVANFPETDVLAAAMTRAGFRDVRWETLTFGISAVHVGTK
jgi:demethylmenaquinone methyltransferase / 2-methoxy-6-polyprenyl-1,4-benzoquinol methylase